MELASSVQRAVCRASGRLSTRGEVVSKFFGSQGVVMREQTVASCL